MKGDHQNAPHIPERTSVARPAVSVTAAKLAIIDGMKLDIEDINAYSRNGCSTCVAKRLNICSVHNTHQITSSSQSTKAFVEFQENKIPPRRTILHPKEYSEYLSIVCTGWAFASVSVSDTRRQILHFLQSGDLVSDIEFGTRMSGRHVVAITEVTVRRFKVTDVKRHLSAREDALEIITELWADMRSQTDQIIASLGRRQGEGRIALLILQLMKKIRDRKQNLDNRMSFPLRHEHIADAVGLTAVQASKILREFKRKRILDIENRVMTVYDEPALFSVAGYYSNS